MKKLLMLGLVLVLWVPLGISATVSGIWLSCPNCSEGEYLQRVPLQVNQRYVVYDLPRGNLRPYEVYCPNVVPFGAGDPNRGEKSSTDAAICSPNEIQILSKNPTGFEATFFDKVVEGWDSTAGQMKVEVDVDYRDVVGYNLIGIDAYRIVSDTNMQTLLGRALHAHPPRNQAPSWVAYMLAHVDAALGFSDTVTLTIKVVLHDGSAVYYEYTLHAPRADYKAGYSITQGGQKIPENPRDPMDGRGVWTDPVQQGGPDALSRFLDYMRSQGVPIVGGGGIEMPRRVSCGSVNGGPVECQVF